MADDEQGRVTIGEVYRMLLRQNATLEEIRRQVTLTNGTVGRQDIRIGILESWRDGNADTISKGPLVKVGIGGTVLGGLGVKLIEMIGKVMGQ